MDKYHSSEMLIIYYNIYLCEYIILYISFYSEAT